MNRILILGLALLCLAFPATADMRGDLVRDFGMKQIVGAEPYPNFDNGLQVNGVEITGLGDTSTTGITAAASGLQADATALTTIFNNVTVVAGESDSVKLPAAVAGMRVVVKNSAASNSVAVFPATGDSINALAVNLSVPIYPGATLTFRAISTTVWESDERIYLPAPTTARGGFGFYPTDNSSYYHVNITNAAHGQDSIYSFPDSGTATANVVLSQGNATIAGIKTFSSAVETGTVGVTGSSLVLESLNPATIKLNDTNAIQLDNAAISGFTAASNAVGTNVYIETQDGGADAAVDGGNYGGLLSLKTGDGGAGGADQVGGAGGTYTLTSGAGGAGGAHTAANPNGGDGADITIIAGAGGAAGSGGAGVAGKPGRVKISAGTFLHTNVQTVNMADATAVLTLVPGTPVGTLMTSNVIYADANSTGTTEILSLPAENECNGMTVYIHNTGGENITVMDDGQAQTLAFLAPDDIGVITCNGTVWQGGTAKQNMTGQFRLNPWDMRTTAGDIVTSSDTAGTFNINTGGAASGLSLLGEVSNGVAGADIETSVCRSRFQVPMNYIAGQSFVVRLRSALTGAGTVVATPTIDLTASILDQDGTLSADLCATAAQNLAAGAPTNKDFTITPTTITPGCIMEFVVTTVVDNNNSTNVQSEVNNFEIRCTVNN